MQEIEVRVGSSGIPSSLQLTSQRSPVHTTTHVSNSHTDDRGNNAEKTSQNDDKDIRHDSDGVNSRGSTTGEDSSSTGANDHHGSSSEGGEEFCPMDLSSAGGTCDPRRENMSPSASVTSALMNSLPSSAAMVAAAAAAAAVAARDSNSSKTNINSKSILNSLPSDILNNHPLFNAHKLAELVRAQKESELGNEIDIKSDLSTRLPKKRAFPELELDLSRMVKEQVLKEHDLEPLLNSLSNRKASLELASTKNNAKLSSDRPEDERNRVTQTPPETNFSKWELPETKTLSQRRSSSPADSNGSESTNNSGASLSGGNAEVKKRRLDALLNKKFSSPPPNPGASPPQRRDSFDTSISSQKSRRRKQPHPSSPASSSSSIHSQHSSPPPLPSQNIMPGTSTNSNMANSLSAVPTTNLLQPGASLSIRPVTELLSKHVNTALSHQNGKNKNTMNNNHTQRRPSNDFTTPSKKHRPNSNSSQHPRSSPSPLKIVKPSNDFIPKHLQGLMDIPSGRGSNDLLMPAIRSPSLASAPKAKTKLEKDTHPSELLKGQLLQLQLAQAAILNGASSALPLQNPEFLKMASLLGAGSPTPSAAANPLLYYGYYAQMLQGVQSTQQKLMDQLTSSSGMKLEEPRKVFQEYPRKRKSNSHISVPNPLDIRPLSSSPLKSSSKNGSIGQRIASALSSKDLKTDIVVSITPSFDYL